MTADERQALRRGLKSADGFTVRRCQVLLASASGAGPATIGEAVGLSPQAVRNAIRAFHASGLGCLARKPPVAKTPAVVWDRKHDSKRVRAWIERHNRRVYRTKQGCRIRVCGLPVKAPWLNAIEPKWVHGKRAIVEPDRKLSAGEVQQRACDYYGCTLHPLLAKPAT